MRFYINTCICFLVYKTVFSKVEYFQSNNIDFFSYLFLCSLNFTLLLSFFLRSLASVCISAEWPVRVAARSQAWFYGRSLAEIAGSNLAEDMDVCPL